MEVGKIIRLVEVYMTNEERARTLVEKYGFHFEQIPKSEIRELIEAEILDFQPGSAEYIRALCGYLFCIGNKSDVELLQRAKFEINMDVGCMIDEEWIDSLHNGGVETPIVRPRAELIEEFMKYYINFEVEDFDSW